MIYTITFNPSLDYIIDLENFNNGKINRTKKETIKAGGKGINVSIVLHKLGIKSCALGFIAGFTGKEINRQLNKLKLKTDFVKLKDGNSRINVKLRSINETEINAGGPSVSQKELLCFYKKLSHIKKEDILVIAGSAPYGMDNSIYCNILELMNKKGVRTIVDASGSLLKNVIDYSPFLIKPNHHELSELAGKELSSFDEVVEYAKTIIDKGVKNVLVSMAEKGAVLVNSTKESFITKAPEGKLVNSVGAGDSMVAGFIKGYLENQDLNYSLKSAVCAGSASAFSNELTPLDLYKKLMNDL